MTIATMKVVQPSLPLVSICIPAYNAERLIGETLESALAQDYPNLEIIVSDDCSTDRTPDIVQSYEGLGVHLIRQEKNLGMHANWNSVIRASGGKYIVKLDADDLLEPKYVSAMVSVMEAHPNITFSHCACRLIDAEGKFIGFERSIHGSFIRCGLNEWPRYALGSRAVNIVMLRRTAYDAVGGYDERFAYSGDWKMHRDLLKHGDVYYNDRILASYRVHAIGKQGLALIGAREGLLHFADMEANWPPSVPGKNLILNRFKKKRAISLVLASVATEQKERDKILTYIPLYGPCFGTYLLIGLIQMGAGKLINYFLQVKQDMRQRVKKILYIRQ